MGDGGVVIVGGGVVGLSVAYFLGKAGVTSTVVERDTIGSHASGFALGGLSPVTGSGVDPVLEAMAFDGMRIHAELGSELPAETGLDTEYGHKPLLTLAFDDAEVRAGMAAVEAQQQYEDYTVRWLEQREARAVEPRISDEASWRRSRPGIGTGRPVPVQPRSRGGCGKGRRLHPQG